MSGKRLLIAVVVMGVALPAILFYFLELHSLSQLFTLSVTCFIAWAVTDMTATVLSQPRLAGRSPRSAIRDWEERRKETDA
jgi:uncharacterized membrane protein